jgi:hypothetical protein
MLQAQILGFDAMQGMLNPQPLIPQLNNMMVMQH